jgi:hypothetical protein
MNDRVDVGRLRRVSLNRFIDLGGEKFHSFVGAQMRSSILNEYAPSDKAEDDSDGES